MEPGSGGDADVEGQPDPAADDAAAGGDAGRHPVDDARRGEAVAVHRGLAGDDVQGDVARAAAHAQDAVDLRAAARRAAEGDHRVPAGVEEALAGDVLVAAGVIGAEAGGVEFGGGRGTRRGGGHRDGAAADGHRAVDRLEAHGVGGGEAADGTGRVDGVGAGPDVGAQVRVHGYELRPPRTAEPQYRY